MKVAPRGNWDVPMLDGQDIPVQNFSAHQGMAEVLQDNFCCQGRAKTTSLARLWGDSESPCPGKGFVRAPGETDHAGLPPGLRTGLGLGIHCWSLSHILHCTLAGLRPSLHLNVLLVRHLAERDVSLGSAWRNNPWPISCAVTLHACPQVMSPGGNCQPVPSKGE